MSIDIRQANPSDAAAACVVLRRSIEEGCKADHARQPAILQAWLGNKTPQNVLAWFSSPSNYAVVAERDGELVGLALLTPAGKLALCYVVPEGLRAGVGRRLLEAVEAEARCRNISKLHMHSPASASPFFARLGYVNAGKDKACFGLECDFMWKHLDAAAPPLCKRFCKCAE